MSDLVLILCLGGLLAFPIGALVRYRLEREAAAYDRRRDAANQRALAELVDRMSDDGRDW